MAKLFEDRGVELLRTYQLNFGGNMDFMNMLERKRLQSKKISKTQAVTSQIPHEMERAAVHIGPSDHVPRSEEHTSELQSQSNLVCRLLLEKKKTSPT